MELIAGHTRGLHVAGNDTEMTRWLQDMSARRRNPRPAARLTGRPRIGTAAAVIGTVVSSLTLAASMALAEEDVARGAVLAAPCASCHGPGGRSPGAIPPLATLAAEDIARFLTEFRSGAREGTVMNRIARGYDAEEIAAIAAYFAAGAP